MSENINGRDSLIKMLLTNQSPTKSLAASPSSTSTCPSFGSTSNTLSNGSPTDSEEESHFSKYLHKLSGQRQNLHNPVIHDHYYAKPWNWRQEHLYFKLTRNLFMTPPPSPQLRQFTPIKDEIIDIETGDSIKQDIPFNIKKEKLDLQEPLPSEEETDWEDKVPKTGWTPIQNRLFQRFARLIELDRLSRLAVESNPGAQMKINNHVKRSANRMRIALSSINWHLSLSRWINHILLTYLPETHLYIYREIVKVLHDRLPDLMNRIIEGSAINLTKVEIPDPSTVSLREMQPLKVLPGRPIFLIVPSLHTPLSPRLEQWCEHFKALGIVIHVESELILDQKMNTQKCVENIISETRAKIAEVLKDYVGKPLILVGWNAGATIALQVALSESKLTACVVMGLAVNTVQGPRGDPSDPLLDLLCPIIFVAGEKATRSRPDLIDELRAKVRSVTGLIVIGAADDHFRVSRSLKTSLGISQAMIDFCMFQEIRNFINYILTQPLPSPNANDFPNKRERKNNKSNQILATTSIQVDASTIRRGPGRPSTNPRGRKPNPLKTKLAAPPTPGNINMPIGPTSSSAFVTPPSSSSTYVNSQQNANLSLNIGSIASLSPVGHYKAIVNNANVSPTPPPLYQDIKEESSKNIETNTSQFTTVLQIQGRSNIINPNSSESPRMFQNSRNKMVNVSKLVMPGKRVLTDGRKTLTSSAPKLVPFVNSSTIPSRQTPTLEAVEETQIITEPVSPMLAGNETFSPDEILSLPIIIEDEITETNTLPQSTEVFNFDINEDIKDETWPMGKSYEDQRNYSSMVLIKGGHTIPPSTVPKRKYRQIFLPNNHKLVPISQPKPKSSLPNANL